MVVSAGCGAAAAAAGSPVLTRCADRAAACHAGWWGTVARCLLCRRAAAAQGDWPRHQWRLQLPHHHHQNQKMYTADIAHPRCMEIYKFQVTAITPGWWIRDDYVCLLYGFEKLWVYYTVLRGCEWECSTFWTGSNITALALVVVRTGLEPTIV